MYQPALASVALPASPATPRRAGVRKKKTAEAKFPLTCEEAIGLAVQELRRLGLAATHRVAALHSAPDVTAEGAPFAAIILPRLGEASRQLLGRAQGWKLLISSEGQVSKREWQARGPRARLARS